MVHHKNVEGPHELAVRLAQNTWIRCVGLSQKSKLLLHIKLKEHEVKECKKTFGLQYMDLLESGASDRALEVCLMGTKTALARLSKEVSDMQEEIQKHEEEMKAKLIEDPTEPSYRKVVAPSSSSSSSNNTTDDEWDVVETAHDTM